MTRSLSEPCLCGDPYCQRCFPRSRPDPDPDEAFDVEEQRNLDEGRCMTRKTLAATPLTDALAARDDNDKHSDTMDSHRRLERDLAAARADRAKLVVALRGVMTILNDDGCRDWYSGTESVDDAANLARDTLAQVLP